MRPGSPENAAGQETARAAPSAAVPPARTATDTAALVLSGVASPFLVLPAFAVAITARYSPDWRVFLLWSGVSVLFSSGFPLLYVLAGIRVGRITDVHVMRREQRCGPFVVALLSTAAGTAVLSALGAPLALVAPGISMVANGILFGLVSLRWKISLHPSVFAGAVICSAFLLQGWLAWLLLLLPGIVWARVRRTRHSVAQGVVAVLLAGVVTLGVLYVCGFVC